MHTLPIRALEIFEAAARNASFKKAAEELLLTPPAISKQIKQLEDLIGERLFSREPNLVKLTVDGEELYDIAMTTIDKAIEASTFLKKLPLKNRSVIINCSPFFYDTLYEELLEELIFWSRQVGVNLYFECSPIKDTINQDILLCSKDMFLGSKNLTVKDISTPPIVPVCTPKFLYLFHNSIKNCNIREIPLLVDLDWLSDWDAWFNMNQWDDPKITKVGFRHHSMMLKAALASEGLAISDLMSISDKLSNKTLIAPFTLRTDLCRTYCTAIRNSRIHDPACKLTWSKILHICKKIQLKDFEEIFREQATTIKESAANVG